MIEWCLFLLICLMPAFLYLFFGIRAVDKWDARDKAIGECASNQAGRKGK